MKRFVCKPAGPLKGEIVLPGDKSIAHRALILSALSRGNTTIENFPANEDCLATLLALKKLGIKYKLKKNRLVITGRGLFGLRKPSGPISLADSGTSYRLLLGLLAGQDFSSELTAGDSLSRRPMRRVTAPLRKMGAIFRPRVIGTIAHIEEYPPIEIEGSRLSGITYKLPVASAQVKSAILLAGLFAKGKTTVKEEIKTRDHTERMLKAFKAKIDVQSKNATIRGGNELRSPKNIYIPVDISSAAFFMVAASIVPGSEVVIKNVGLNPTRIGVLKVLKRMKADIRIIKTFNAQDGHCFEPSGDIVVKHARLRGTVVRKEEVPSLIDELPILMVASSLARGKSRFEGVGELRVKETDRINSMVDNLQKMGADITSEDKGAEEDIIICGKEKLTGSFARSFGDHRTAMSMIVAGLSLAEKSSIDDISCINKSFPDFITVLESLKA